MIDQIRVSKDSNVNAVAGSLANILRNQKSIEVQTIGAGALNQAIKAIAITRGYLTPSGIDIVVIPSFGEITIEGEIKTAIRLKIEKRSIT